MWKIFNNRKTKAHNFDIKVLFKNDISLLILDERWNNLFIDKTKTPEIGECENGIKELLKEQARLIAEVKEINITKKENMDSILKLTTEAYDNNNEDAKLQMQQCEKTVVSINARLKQIEARLDEIPKEIRQLNLKLLELTVNIVYYSMRANQVRVAELDKQIEEEREKLKSLIDERGSLTQNDTDTYSYFHDLIGGDELQKLDDIYFGKN